MIQVLSLILEGISGIIVAILEGIFSFFSAGSSSGSGSEYNAYFADTSTILSRWDLGFSLGGGLKATTRNVATKNALVIGPSGSGKTSTVLVGSIFTLARGGSSMCVMDVSGELFSLTSGYLEREGYKIYCINFGNTSDSFNFLHLCKDLTDIQKTAFLLIKNSGIESKNDPYWSMSAEMMLTIFIEYLVFHVSKEYCTVANLVKLVDTFAGSPAKVDMLFVKTRNIDIISRYKAMNAVSERTLQSTLATVRSALKVFGSPALKYCTATNTVDFSNFRKEKSVLYICTPITDVDYYAPLSALLFDALFKEMMARVPDTKTEKYVFCLMDEMITMKFQNLGLVFANCRKYAMGCMGVIQDEKMLEISMSSAEAHAIKTNCYSKVYLPGQPLHTCTELQEILGKYTVYKENGSEKARWLSSSSEIRMKNEAIVLVGNKPPVSVELKYYFNHWKLRRLTKLPPYVLSVKNVNEPPILSFDEA